MVPDAGMAGSQTGSVVWANNLVDPMIGDPAIAPYRSWEQSAEMGVTESLFVMEDGDPMAPHLATSWEVSPDGKIATIKIRQGIPWQSPPGVNENFGEFTAHDVAWFMNRQNSTTNPESTSGDAGDFAAVFGEARAVDDYTVEFDLKSPTFFGLPLSAFGVLGAAPSIRSKAVFDTMGTDWMRDHAVGTGPFLQVEWVDNERGVVEAIPEHWRDTATISRFTKLQVPEPSSRVAMVESGQADVAVVDFKLVPGLVEKGVKFYLAGPNDYVGQSIIWAGNLWEETYPLTGEPLGNTKIAPDYVDPWLSAPYEQDYAWIGNPWCDMGKPCQYQDNNNPSGMSDMEQARLVRVALSMAIDREGINDFLLGGLGTPIYSEYMGPEYPGWDPNRVAHPVDAFTGEPIAADGTNHFDFPWQLEFDPDMAMELLERAGYGDGFDINLQAYVAETGEVTLEAADNITSQWSAIGVNVTQNREDYGSVISPRMRQRVQFNPVVKNGDVHSNVFPLDWPYPPVDSALSRPGWGIAFETPVLSGNHLAIRASQDKAFREQMHMATADYILYWQLYSGMYQIPKGVIGNPDRIESWQSRPQHYVNYGMPQFIRMAQ
jgi:ABC-type transport system substrate-binding protein